MLLLIFPQPQTFTGWTPTTVLTTTWLGDGFDFKHHWGDWSTYTWGAITASDLNWGNMKGYTFSSTSSKPSTIWTVVT